MHLIILVYYFRALRSHGFLDADVDPTNPFYFCLVKPIYHVTVYMLALSSPRIAS